MKNLGGDRLFNTIVLLIVATMIYVVIVGGIVCILDTGYGFDEYLIDLNHMVKWVVATVLIVLLKIPIDKFNGRHKDREDK